VGIRRVPSLRDVGIAEQKVSRQAVTNPQNSLWRHRKYSAAHPDGWRRATSTPYASSRAEARFGRYPAEVLSPAPADYHTAMSDRSTILRSEPFAGRAHVASAVAGL
jgi:hypothetical protein